MPNPSPLPPAVFEAVVTAFAETLVRHYRERFESRQVERAPVPPVPKQVPVAAPAAPWLRVSEAAKRASCGRSTIYAAIQAGQLRIAKVGGGRIVRIKPEWVDEWLQGGGTRR